MLNRCGVPYLVGGTYAFRYYAGICRTTKDFDIFARPRDVDRVLDVLAAVASERRWPFITGLRRHTTAKNSWTSSSTQAMASLTSIMSGLPRRGRNRAGRRRQVAPAEEMIWTKAPIMERSADDGADVAHLLRHSSARGLGNTPRATFRAALAGALSHLHSVRLHLPWRTLVDPVCPHQGAHEPRPGRARRAHTRQQGGPGHGLLSRAQYLVDVEEWGYEDARLQPRSSMTPEQIAEWTAGIDKSH